MKSTLLSALARELEPVEHRRVVAVRIARASVRPEALAGDDVLEPVAVHVDEVDGVHLGELHAVCVVLRLLVHDDVLAEFDLAALAILLVPRQAEAVRGERGDDVVQAVAVHVVGIHLRAAGAHRLRVKRHTGSPASDAGCSHQPSFSSRSSRPSPFTSPRPMPCVKLPYLLFGRDGMERPRLRRIAPIRRGVAVLALGDADQLGLAVAGQVGKRRRLVVGLVEDLVPHPVAVLALRDSRTTTCPARESR